VCYVLIAHISNPPTQQTTPGVVTESVPHLAFAFSLFRGGFEIMGIKDAEKMIKL
jgi:hypothetical protein